jgi:hypothetical protein
MGLSCQKQYTNGNSNPDSNCLTTSKHLEIDASELSMLLSGIDLASVKRRKRYVAPDLPTTNPSAVA